MAGRSLRGIKGEDALKAFVRAGGVMRSGKGSHANIKLPSGQLITVPRTGELKIGLLSAAVSKAGLASEAFAKLL